MTDRPVRVLLDQVPSGTVTAVAAALDGVIARYPVSMIGPHPDGSGRVAVLTWADVPDPEDDL